MLETGKKYVLSAAQGQLTVRVISEVNKHGFVHVRNLYSDDIIFVNLTVHCSIIKEVTSEEADKLVASHKAIAAANEATKKRRAEMLQNARNKEEYSTKKKKS